MCNSIPYVLPISRQALIWSNTFMWYIYLSFVKSHNSEIHRVFQPWFCAIGYILTITATVTTNSKLYLLKSRITRRHRGGPCVKQIHFDVRYFIFIRNKIPLTEVARDPFYYRGFTLIPVWISNHMSNKMWDKITYPFPNFNGCRVEVVEWISNFIPHFIMEVITSPCWD